MSNWLDTLNKTPCTWVLQMTGTAEVILKPDEIKNFKGAQILWSFKPARIIRRQNAEKVDVTETLPRRQKEEQI